MSTDKLYALVGRYGHDGGLYASRQWKQLKERAWVMNRAGNLVQVWRAASNGDLLSYDAQGTRRVSDYIVKARNALAKPR